MLHNYINLGDTSLNYYRNMGKSEERVASNMASLPRARRARGAFGFWELDAHTGGAAFTPLTHLGPPVSILRRYSDTLLIIRSASVTPTSVSETTP